MATRNDILEARGVFLQQLDVEREVAVRVFEEIQGIYSREIILAEREDLLYAARWAADRLLARFGPATLATITRSELRAALTEGCPLCAGPGTPTNFKIGSQGGAPIPAGGGHG